MWGTAPAARPDPPGHERRAYDAEGSEALSEEVSELEALAREAFQAKLSDTFKPVLEKLKKGQSLTPDELKMLELLVLGDAEYYLRAENDIENWKSQVRSLLEQIRSIRTGPLDDVDGLMRLRAVCRETLELLSRLAFYLGEKERVRKFQEATSQPWTRKRAKLLLRSSRRSWTLINSDGGTPGRFDRGDGGAEHGAAYIEENDHGAHQDPAKKIILGTGEKFRDWVVVEALAVTSNGGKRSADADSIGCACGSGAHRNRDVQQPGAPAGAMRQRLGRHRRAAQTPLRPDPQPGRNGQRVRRA